MKIIECAQYDATWWAARRGVPTASEFGCILTPKTQKYAAAADDYICRLIGDTFDPAYPRIDRAVSDAMRRGTEQEPESRAYYELTRDLDVQQVGFCTTDDGRFGCSPDGLIVDKMPTGDEGEPVKDIGFCGCLELKNPDPKTQVAYLLDGTLPAEYRAQCHGHLIVSGMDWVDFLSYCPGLPPLLLRVEPDSYTDALRAALETFWTAYQSALEKIRNA